MITDRLLKPEDMEILAESLSKDIHHTTTKPEFFVQEGTACKVFEDEKGPILFLRGAKSLRLDIQFVDNMDYERNRKTMLEHFPKFAEMAKANGFLEVVFNTSSPLLKRFCKQQLGFEVVEGDELRKAL